MKNQILYDDEPINFKVIRSGRIKTSEITVEPTGVIVRVPLNKDKVDVEKIVRRKAGWIVNKQNEYSKMASEVARPTFQDGSRLPYLGKMVPLRIFYRNEQDKIRLLREEFVVTLKSGKPVKQTIQLLYDNWLDERAEKLLSSLVAKYCTIVGVCPRKIVVKKMKKRWGSATKDNILNLNANLLKAPKDVIDYVILHELCHLKIRNHSHHFWELVRKYMPSYKQRENWLSKNSIGLIE